MKRNIFVVLIAGIIILSFVSCSTSEPSDKLSSSQKRSANSQLPSDAGNDSVSAGSNSESDSIESGNYEISSDLKISFKTAVRNDATGNWRLSTTADSANVADYAFEYYQKMFSSDEEIHAIWNATLGTMTRISVSGNLLFVDTLEYVKGEEHDAKLMFSGNVLDSKIINLETGEPFEG